MKQPEELQTLVAKLKEIPLEDEDAVESLMVVIEWQEKGDHPRVLPPIIRARENDTIRFYYRDPGRAEIHLPKKVYGGSVPVIDNTAGLGGGYVDVRTGNGSRSLPGCYYEYAVMVCRPRGTPVAGVGNSPPGMVLDEPRP